MMMVIITANVYIVSSALNLTCNSFSPLNHQEEVVKHILKDIQLGSEIGTQAVCLQGLHT